MKKVMQIRFYHKRSKEAKKLAYLSKFVGAVKAG